MTTPNSEMSELVSGQSNAEITVNEALNRADHMISLAIEDRDFNAPPGGESDGETWIVGASGSGDWSGHNLEIAFYTSGWTFLAPFEGLSAYIKDEDVFAVYDGSAWKLYGTQAAAVADLDQDISAGYVEAEVQAISDKVDELLAALRLTSILAT